MHRIPGAWCVGALIGQLAFCSLTAADSWLLQPSIAFDQRLDDNYLIEPGGSERVFSSRIVGSLGLSRESATTSHAALIQLDGLLEAGDARTDELQSNQSLFLSSDYFGQRARYGVDIAYRRDKPNQAIGNDLTDPADSALDTGADTDQTRSVRRQRLEVSPSWSFELTRRSQLEAGLRLTAVEHELTDPQDALIDRYTTLVQQCQRDPAQPVCATLQLDPLIPIDELTFDDVPTPFRFDDELDDFREARVDLGWRYALSPITTFSLRSSYSDFRSETEAQENVVFDFSEQIPDPDQRFVLRDPTRESLSNTVTLRAGIEHSFSPTLRASAEIGVFRTEDDDRDLLREDDDTNFSGNAELTAEEQRQRALDNRVSTEDGWLAALSFTQDLGVQRIAARISVDVEPSSVGSQVEALEFIGDYHRRLNPLLDAFFQVRAYEPDAIDPGTDDDFKRRFLSLEPKLVWRFSRAWTSAVSYRYRRQRSQTDEQSGESNALLFSIIYSPPSALADAAARR